MEATVNMSVDAVHAFVFERLIRLGLSAAHADAVAATIAAGERDECHSHGLYRMLGTIRTIRSGKVGLAVTPEVTTPSPAIVRVDARYAFAPLAHRAAAETLIDVTRKTGVAALAINNCFHFSALWAEVEPLAQRGLVALAMNPSHSWVAPTGGSRPVFGTNPIAFAWPRHGTPPFVFDFATSAVARGEIELHQRAGKPVPLGWGIDADGNDTTDPAAILSGAMNTFGGHKGSALAAMVELLAGALIGDLISFESKAADYGPAPLHGELVIAFDPERFLGAGSTAHLDRAEQLFAAMTQPGARLPSERRYEARTRSLANGVTIPRKLIEDIDALLAAG